MSVYWPSIEMLAMSASKLTYLSKIRKLDRARKEIPKLPWLPVAEDKPTVLLSQTFKHAEFPPLFKDKSWTKSVPFKDRFEYFRPMDSIASCITPSANMLRLVDLPPPKRKIIKPSGCLDEKGKLQYPPKDFRFELKKPKKSLRQIFRPNVVKLRDLLTGEYDKKMQKIEAAKKQRRKTVEARSLQLEIKKNEDEIKILEQLQAVLPVHPDDQLFVLRQQVEAEQSKTVRPEDVERIQYYLFEVFML
ncbi:uncharacterized protein LOC142317535 [Lycorma delicatula]|uniref:uncharacterized protein LOC142317535 n=1 Tax=Lycorma delicatula TaxID=130591 RepID=UPI003F512AF7